MGLLHGLRGGVFDTRDILFLPFLCIPGAAKKPVFIPCCIKAPMYTNLTTLVSSFNTWLVFLSILRFHVLEGRLRGECHYIHSIPTFHRGTGPKNQPIPPSPLSFSYWIRPSLTISLMTSMELSTACLDIWIHQTKHISLRSRTHTWTMRLGRREKGLPLSSALIPCPQPLLPAHAAAGTQTCTSCAGPRRRCQK